MALDNYALQLDGVDDECRASVDNLPTSNEDRTIECRVRADNSDNAAFIWWGNKSNNNQNWFGQISGNFAFGWYGDNVQGSQIYNTGWHHVAVTIDSDLITLYLDGKVDGQTTHTVETGFSDLRIGTEPSGNFLEGAMDEIRIWNRALSQSEIQNNMNSPLNGDETGLIAYYPADTGSGTTLYDNTANGYDATITGASWLLRKLSGNVTLDNSAVQGAKVFLINSTQETLVGSKITDTNGYYEFTDLPASDVYHALVEYSNGEKYNAKSLPFLNS